MIELIEWARRYPHSDRPWLVLGKGPSFSGIHELDVTAYNLISLNHVVRELKVDVAHFADLHAIEGCADAVLHNADWVLMPYRPHINYRIGQSLSELVHTVPVLGELERLNRLVWYNLSTGTPIDGSPVIQTGQFGSEVVVNILATLGVKVIRTLGIDGGRSYDPRFHDLTETNMLTSGASSYDLQWVGIHRTVTEKGIDFGPLTRTIRIFIGTDETQTIAARVLEYTIRKNTTRPVEFVHLDKIDVPLPRDPSNQPRTLFSFKRFAIPALCGYRGQALYLDADMVVFGDVAELWDRPMAPFEVLCTWQPEAPEAWRHHPSFKPGRQMSVMLLDCARLQWDATKIVQGLDEGRYTYEQLMFDLCVISPDKIAETLPPEWNCLEWYDPGTTKLLHYTVVETQPWKTDVNPLGHIWTALYAEAVAAGAVPRGEVDEGIAKGFLKPALAAALSVALPPATSETSVQERAPSRLYVLELEARAARAEALMASARVAKLEAETIALKDYVEEMNHSWNWRVGRIVLAPPRTALRVFRKIARSRTRPPVLPASPEALPALYREMHAKGLFPGVTWRSILQCFTAAIPDLDDHVILDFGCGPRGGLSEQFGPDRVVAYDPYVEAYSALPWERHFDVVFSSDVLEHLLPQHIEEFASNVLRALPQFIFLNISTREAHKTFSDGVNVHVTVKPSGWWRDTFNRFWGQTYEYRLLREEFDECTILFTRRESVVEARQLAASSARISEANRL